MTPRPPTPTGAWRVVSGLLLVARFRAAGFDRLGDTRQAFLTSLAPLLAFPLAGLALNLLGGGRGAFSDFLMTVAAVLAPPVISHALAARWGREALWPRFATAFNWCQWAVPAMAAALLLVLGLLLNAGLPQDVAEMGFVVALASYALWLHWFVTRHALGLGRWRAALLVALVNAGTALLALGPRLLTLL